MFKTGTIQKLHVSRLSEYGAFLAYDKEGEEEILLPLKKMPLELKEDDEIEVFIYRNSDQELVATTEKPLITANEIAFLKVVNEITAGYFLDMGLDKDLFLPNNEAKGKLTKGRSYLVKLLVNDKDQLVATMKIYNHLETAQGYKVGDTVQATIIEIKEDRGVFVAIDQKYHGMLPQNEMYPKMRLGEELTCRVTKVREDGKINLSMRHKVAEQIHDDCDVIMNALETSDGVLYLDDYSDPEAIRHRLQMSKKAYKRAVGKLYKEKKITFIDKGIKKI